MTNRTPKPEPTPTPAWVAALTADTIVASIHPAHIHWLATAAPGSRLLRDNDTGDIGHLYPDTERTPLGWTLVATKPASGAHSGTNEGEAP